MSNVDSLQDVELVKKGEHISLRFLFNNELWRSLEINKPMTADQFGKHLIHLGQKIVYETKLKEREQDVTRKT